MQITPEDWRDLLLRLDRTERLAAKAAVSAGFVAAAIVFAGTVAAFLWFSGYFAHAGH